MWIITNGNFEIFLSAGGIKNLEQNYREVGHISHPAVTLRCWNNIQILLVLNSFLQ
jgi:hypothetical protein